VIYKKRAKKLKAIYRKIFGDVDDKKEERKKGKIKEFEEKYIKRWLILNYEERKGAIQEEKRRRKEELFAE